MVEGEDQLFSKKSASHETKFMNESNTFLVLHEFVHEASEPWWLPESICMCKETYFRLTESCDGNLQHSRSSACTCIVLGSIFQPFLPPLILTLSVAFSKRTHTHATFTGYLHAFIHSRTHARVHTHVTRSVHVRVYSRTRTHARERTHTRTLARERTQTRTSRAVSMCVYIPYTNAYTRTGPMSGPMSTLLAQSYERNGIFEIRKTPYR